MSFWLSMLSGSVCISDKIKYTAIRPLYVLFEGVADIHIIYIYTSVMIWNRGKHEFPWILSEYRVMSWEKCDIMEPMGKMMEKWREFVFG